MQPATLNEFTKIAPEEFLRKLRKLWTSQVRELKKIVGKPPKIDRVKPEHWTKWRKDQEAALLLLMVGATMINLRSQVTNWRRQLPDQIEPQEIERTFVQSVRARARFASRRITQTSRQRLADLFRRARTQSTEVTEEPVDIDSIFSPARSEMVTTTEMTAARSASTRAVHDSMARRDIQCQLVWSLRPCNHCDVCPMLDRTPESFWRQFTNGPPVHPHCCCQLIILIGTRSELIRTGQMNRNPSIAAVRAAFNRSAFRIRPTV